MKLKNLIISSFLGLAALLGLPITDARRGTAFNVGEGTHERSLNKLADAAQTTRHLLVKFGTDVDHIAVNTAAGIPLGTCPDEPALGDLAAVWLLGKGGTKKMVVSGATTLMGELWTDAGGKVQAPTATAGTYYKVGYGLNVTSADGDIVEALDCSPVKIVVT